MHRCVLQASFICIDAKRSARPQLYIIRGALTLRVDRLRRILLAGIRRRRSGLMIAGFLDKLTNYRQQR